MTLATPTLTPPPGIHRRATPPAADARHAFIKRHAVLMYCVLTFAISWGGILLIVGGPAGIPGTPEQIERLMPFAILFMLFGPSIAGIAMPGLTDGKAGYRVLFSQLVTWRVPVRGYAVALLTAPLVFTVVLVTLSHVSPTFLPAIVTTNDRVTLLLTATSAALLVGLLEELGWTGFVIPRLRLRHRILTSGLMVGIIWGVWHLLTNDVWAAGVSSGGLPVGIFVAVNGFLFLVGQLPAFRVLMVWVYDRTRSLLVAMLMHASLLFSTFVFGPAVIAGENLLVYGLGLAIGMWIVVAAVAKLSPAAGVGKRPPRRAWCLDFDRPTGGMKVLVIDDDRPLREALEVGIQLGVGGRSAAEAAVGQSSLSPGRPQRPLGPSRLVSDSTCDAGPNYPL